MEIKVVGKEISMGLFPEIATVTNLKTAFIYKGFRDAISDIYGLETHIFLQTARRRIEVRKECPRYRVRVCVPFVSACENGWEYFETFEAAMKRIEEAYGLGFFDVDLEKYRLYDNGVKRWEPVG